MHWLGNGQLPLVVRGGVWPLALRKECADHTTLLGLFNLGLDPWPQWSSTYPLIPPLPAWNG